MSWATTGDVVDITGVTVSTADLAQACSVVAVYSGRSVSDSGRISTADLEWLRQATAWQAAKQSADVAFSQRGSVGSLSQDGVSVNFNTEWQSVLAPMAARALKNLSWKRSRTTGRRRVPAYLNFCLESSDPYTRWADL